MRRHNKWEKRFFGQFFIYGLKLAGLVGMCVAASWLSLKVFEAVLLIFGIIRN